MHKTGILTTLTAGLLAGCSMAPKHVRPATPAPSVYSAEIASDSSTGVYAPKLGWRDFIQDERLEALIATSLEKNRDLRIAVAQIEEARGVYRVQRADRLPSVAVTGEGTRSQVDGDGSVEVDRAVVGVAVPAFELDLWGRVRSLSEAARSQYLATVAAQRAVQLSLIREVASTYLGSVEAAERIRLAEATVQSRREGLRIAQVRLEAGITSALDYRQAESLLTQAEAQLASLRLTRARLENALAVLVGGPVDSLMPEPLPLEQQASTIALAPGLTSDLLTARPDIIAAEERLRAARANIGAARAAFFPRISLTGLFGYASSELEDLFSGSTETWSFGPTITMPLFNYGKNRANLSVARAREDIAVATYERTIQNAFREVSDGLAGRQYLAEQVAAQERATEAQRAIAELARERYNEGVVGYLEVLDAERNLFAAEQALLQLRRAQAENLISLYVTLGGGLIE